MNSTIKTLIWAFCSFVFVIFSVLAGRFLLPFVVWCTNWKLLAVLSILTGFLCLVGLVLAWVKRSKIIAGIAVPILLSVCLNNLWFILRFEVSYEVGRMGRYLVIEDCLGRSRAPVYTKFGNRLIDSRGGVFFAYTDRREQMFVVWNYNEVRDSRDSDGDDLYEWCCDVYDSDGDPVDRFTGRFWMNWRESYKARDKAISRIKSELRGNDYMVPGD